jgi:hypothetical protein
MRNTCEVCEEDDISKCRSCDLSGEPNPEAFSREELVRALITEYRFKENNKSTDAAQLSLPWPE